MLVLEFGIKKFMKNLMIRTAIYICCQSQFLYGYTCAIRCMHQPIRVLGKSELQRFPVFGWIYRAAVILVDRDSAEKRARSVRALKAALRRGISIFIFPEGHLMKQINH